jgi:hypothetical protein
MVRFYRLDDRNCAVELRGEIEYYAWLKGLPKAKRTMIHVIVATDAVRDMFIGTYFLGSDRYAKDKRCLWQTIVYDDQRKLATLEYTSHCDAVAGHKQTVEIIKSRGGEAKYRR